MSLIRLRRERKEMGTGERRGLRTRTLFLLLVVVLIAIWYVGQYV